MYLMFYSAGSYYNGTLVHNECSSLALHKDFIKCTH